MSSNSIVENVVQNVVVGVVKKEVNPKLPAKYVRIYQCVWEVLNSCVTEPTNGVAVTEELMEGILGVMGFYGDLSEQMEFFNDSIFEKESLKATKKGMKVYLKMMKMKSDGALLDEVPKKVKKVKDPNAPKKERAPRKKKVVVVVVPEVVVSDVTEPEVVVSEVTEPVVIVSEEVLVTTPVMEEKKVAKKVKKTTKVLVDVPSDK